MGTCRSPCERKRCPDNQHCRVHGGMAECLASETEAPARSSNGTCNSDVDCRRDAACNLVTKACEDPCSSPFWKRRLACTQNQECKVQGHVPQCVCKAFLLTEKMELICPEAEPEKCGVHGDCELGKACIFGTCQDPCLYRKCPPDKACQTLHHAPYCLCAGAQCNTTVEICLKDSGCPKDRHCLNYQCGDPCESFQCPPGHGCFVHEHRPFCKVCKLSGQVDLCKGND